MAISGEPPISISYAVPNTSNCYVGDPYPYTPWYPYQPYPYRLWEVLPSNPPQVRGWICPRCGAVNSPSTAQCFCHPQTRYTITITSNTSDEVIAEEI